MLRKSLCIAGFLAALAATPSYADITVGVILSLTGQAASIGTPAKDTIALWPKEIDGQKVNVIVLDDGSDPTGATLAARKLVSENNVDVIIGPSVTPTSIAVLQVAGETQTPMISLGGGGGIVTPTDGPRHWAFKMPPPEEIPLRMIFSKMKAAGQHKLAIVAISNAYGQTFLDVAQKMAGDFGVTITDVERFSGTDTSFVSQALKIVSSDADAVFIAAAGTPAATPEIELRSRGFRGVVYQTQAVANNDFLRVGGTALQGTYLPVSPLLVAEQLPDSNPVKAVAVSYVRKYENLHGAGSRSLFGGIAWDAFLLVERATPSALKHAQPGTPAFRAALRDALEQTKDLTLTQGVYTMSPTDHTGADQRSQVMVEINNGKWQYVP